MDRVTVEGENKSHKVFLYTLSTCGWCKKTKQLLKDHGYEYLDLDTASKEEKANAVAHLKKRGVSIAFPIIIVDDEKVISGFRAREIKEALDI